MNLAMIQQISKTERVAKTEMQSFVDEHTQAVLEFCYHGRTDRIFPSLLLHTLLLPSSLLIMALAWHVASHLLRWASRLHGQFGTSSLGRNIRRLLPKVAMILSESIRDHLGGIVVERILPVAESHDLPLRFVLVEGRVEAGRGVAVLDELREITLHHLR